MTSGETVIALLLGIIAWFLYQIAKQLSYLTGKKIRFRFFNWKITNPLKQSRTQMREQEKLPN